MDLVKAVSELNAVYEAKLIEHVRRSELINTCEINLFEPFYGMEWGIEEWNSQRQKWRWLGPRGQSHIYLRLSPDTDHLIRIFIHTAVSGPVLDALTVMANGTVCKYQDLERGADGVVSKWGIVDRSQVEEGQGVVKVTWSLLPPPGSPEAAAMAAQPGQLSFARSIAFSRVECSPWPPPQPAHIEQSA